MAYPARGPRVMVDPALSGHGGKVGTKGRPDIYGHYPVFDDQGKLIGYFEESQLHPVPEGRK